MPPLGSLRSTARRRAVLGLLVLGGVMMTAPVGAALPGDATVAEAPLEATALPVPVPALDAAADPAGVVDELVGADPTGVAAELLGVPVAGGAPTPAGAGDAGGADPDGNEVLGLPLPGFGGGLLDRDGLGGLVTGLGLPGLGGEPIDVLGAVTVGVVDDPASPGDEPEQDDGWRLFFGADRPVDTSPTAGEVAELACDGRKGRIRVDDVALVLGLGAPDAACPLTGVPGGPPAGPGPAPAPGTPGTPGAPGTPATPGTPGGPSAPGADTDPVSLRRPAPVGPIGVAVPPAGADMGPAVRRTAAPAVPLPRTGPGGLLQGPAAAALLAAGAALRAVARRRPSTR